MPYIRIVNYRDTHIAGLELVHRRLAIDIFGGEGGRLNDLGLHDPVSTPCDTFCMDYDDENEANTDFALLQEWMDHNLPLTVEIFDPLKIIFSTNDYPETVVFEQRDAKHNLV